MERSRLNVGPLSRINVAASQSPVYFPRIQAVYHGWDPGVSVIAFTVTVRSEAKLLADTISADVPEPSRYPFTSLHVGARILQSGLEGSLLKVVPIDVVTVMSVV